jgi:hypothetical protein
LHPAYVSFGMEIIASIIFDRHPVKQIFLSFFCSHKGPIASFSRWTSINLEERDHINHILFFHLLLSLHPASVSIGMEITTSMIFDRCQINLHSFAAKKGPIASCMCLLRHGHYHFKSKHIATAYSWWHMPLCDLKLFDLVVIVMRSNACCR